jgi:predicted aspartyl protease
MKMKALLDSGANAIYINKAYAQKMKLPLTLLADLIPEYNIDGTRNAAGSITHCAEIIIQFQEHHEKVTHKSDRFGKESNDSRLHVAFAS